MLAGAALFLPSVGVLADIGLVEVNANEYLRVEMGVNAEADVLEPIPIDQLDDPQPQRKARAGRWGIKTIKGDPETADDDNLPLIQTALDFGPAWHYGYTTILYDEEQNDAYKSVVYGDDAAGGWVLSPYASSREVGNYVGVPSNSYHSGPYINSQWFVPVGNGYIGVQLRLAIIRDQVRIEAFIINNDTSPHNVGMRHCVDSTTNGWTDRISYPFIPGRGIVMSETDLIGNDIPDYFELYSDKTTPKVTIRANLKGEDATPPDRVAIGDWLNIQSNDWDYTPIPDRAFSDYGFALWWDPILLNPGESRIIITYMGVAAASSSWTSSTGSTGSMIRQDPFVVATQGPRSLPINYSSTQTSTPDIMLTSNPFKIKAYVYNLFRDTTLRNVNVHLTLPPGLELESGSAMQEVLSIAPESESPAITWNVKANGTVAGELNYMVSVSGTPGLQKTVTRPIVIPATGTTQFSRGWQLVSAPFVFSNPQIAPALGLAADTYEAYSYDPQISNYRSVTSIEPGKGFWLKSNIDRSPTTVASDARPLVGTESNRIVLYTGWNLFGNPYLYNIPWGRIQVLGASQDGPLSIQEAANRGLIRSTIYWWDIGAGEYKMSSDRLTMLIPWQGYWIKALQPCQLIIPAVEQVNGGITGDTTRSRAADLASTTSSKTDGWRLKLVAKAGTTVDSCSLLGVDSRAKDNYDSSDIERPPSPGNYVSISFPHRDWGVNNGDYLSDIRRSTGGDQTWEFTVNTDQKNTDIVLTWPTISEISKDYMLKLVDVDGGTTKYMRTTSSYRFNSGVGGARRFKLVAEPRGNAKLLVSGLTVNASRAISSATISYNLSSDCSSDVAIKSSSGRVVRSLAKGKSVTRGINNLRWDYRDEAGKAVPTGSYLLEVVATTPEGEVAKTVRPFLVAR
jgi:hypothetical protein